VINKFSTLCYDGARATEASRMTCLVLGVNGWVQGEASPAVLPFVCTIAP